MKYFFFLLLAATACKSVQPVPGTNATSPLVGEWRNVYMKVTMHTFKNSDSTRIMEVSEDNWEEKLKSRVIRTFFRADGTYNSEHRNLQDSIVYNPAGYWTIKGDSIFMRDTFPQRDIHYTYWISVNGNIATFRGLEDFDQDGKKDDEYYGTQRKQ